MGATDEQAVRPLLQAAAAAPSIHNSQPWRFRVHGNGGPGTRIEVHADWRHRIEVVDPDGRQLVISVGAALFNLRLAIHHSGHCATVRLSPDPRDEHHLATVELGGVAAPDAVLNELALAIPRRHTNRLPFRPDPVPPRLVHELAAAASAEGARLRAVSGPARTELGRLVRAAQQRLRDTGVYQAELSQWRQRPQATRRVAESQTYHPERILHQPIGWHAAEAVPLRDFGLVTPFLGGTGVPESRHPALLVLGTPTDGVQDRIRAGLALQRTWLTATVHGLAVAPMSQPLDVPALRALLTGPEQGGWPQVILLVGYAPPTAQTPRRDVAESIIPES